MNETKESLLNDVIENNYHSIDNKLDDDKEEKEANTFYDKLVLKTKLDEYTGSSPFMPTISFGCCQKFKMFILQT